MQLLREDNKSGSVRRIAYIVPGFPIVSQMFAVSETLELRHLGVQVYVFPLRPLNWATSVKGIEDILSHTYFSSFFGGPVLAAHVYFLRHQPHNYSAAFLMAIKAHRSSTVALLKAMATFLKSVYFASLIESLEIEHIHAHYVHFPTTSAMIVSRLTKIPFSCTAHASDIYQYPPTDLLERVRIARPFITISEFNKRHLLNLFQGLTEKDIEVVHCGVNLDEHRRALGQEQNQRTRILTAVRLEPVKGLPVLIEACHMLSAKGYDFQCDIVGDGSQKNELSQLIDRYGLRAVVYLRGAIPHDDIYVWYKAADIFVLSSLGEGIPVCAMEAMSMELPVVATNVRGVPELVQHNTNGLLVPAGDASALARAIERLMNDGQLRSEFGKKGQVKVCKEFNVRETAKQLYGLWFSERRLDRCECDVDHQ